MSLDVNISEPEEFNCVELHSCIKDVAEAIGISDFEYHVDLISGTGENYVANIFRVVIKECDKDNSVGVIVKTLVNTTRQELFYDIHEREVDVYKEVIPKFKEIQMKVDSEQRIWFPVCLYANGEKCKEVIILKDLKDMGFGMEYTLNKYDILTFSRAKLILTELAKFHALSFVYEKEYQNSVDMKNKYSDIIFQDRFLSKTKMRNYFYDSFDISLKFVRDGEAKRKLEKVKEKILDILRSYHQPSKYNVLCHGDLWVNNILFKNDSDKEEICFLDFQAMRYCSPATDIIYFMYLCTTSEFRSDNFGALTDAYYDSFVKYLKLFNIDASKVFPKEDFEKELTDKLPYGLLIALIELRIITTSPEDEAILKGSKIVPEGELAEVPGEIQLFIERVNDVVNESAENGVLDRLLSLINT